MNRTIKFRVWSKKYKMFDDNFGWPDNQRAWEEFLLDAYGNLKEFITNDNEHFLCNSTNDEDFTIQQFTGLFDKFGREIYEGDIIKDTWKVNYPYGYRPDEFIDDQSIFEVKYFPPSFNLEIKRSGDQTCIEDFAREVIGNIFETPELLKNEN